MSVLDRDVDGDNDTLEVDKLELQFTIHANGLALIVYPYREWDTEHNCQTREELFKNS